MEGQGDDNIRKSFMNIELGEPEILTPGPKKLLTQLILINSHSGRLPALHGYFLLSGYENFSFCSFQQHLHFAGKLCYLDTEREERQMEQISLAVT